MSTNNLDNNKVSEDAVIVLYLPVEEYKEILEVLYNDYAYERDRSYDDLIKHCENAISN